MGDVFETIKNWQELLGAIIGAIGSLVVAFVVAGSAQRRAERSAGMIITGILVEFIGLSKKLSYEWEREPDKEQKSKDDWIGGRALWMWPGVPHDFEAFRTVLCEVDNSLAVRLSLLSQHFRTMNDVKMRFDAATLQQNFVNQPMLRGDRVKLRIVLEEGAPIAYGAVRIIEKSVLSKWWRWHRFLRWIRNDKSLDAKLLSEYEALAHDKAWPT